MELAGQGEKIWCKQECHHHVGYDHGREAKNQEEKIQRQKSYQITKFLQYSLYQDDEQNREQKVHEEQKSKSWKDVVEGKRAGGGGLNGLERRRVSGGGNRG